MSVLIVTHPHKFDNGLIKNKLVKLVESGKIESYCIPDGHKRPYGGEKIYNGVLKPEKTKSLQKYGRASLKDEHADSIVANNSRVYLAGGFVSECLASTYLSLVRAAERNNKKLQIVLVKDLIYAKYERKNIIIDLQALIDKLVDSDQGSQQNINDKYFSQYRDTELVDHDFVSAKQIINAPKGKI